MSLTEQINAIMREKAEIWGRKEVTVTLTVNQLVALKLAIEEVQEVHEVSEEDLEHEYALYLSTSHAAITEALNGAGT
jgi:hypothetical protein